MPLDATKLIRPGEELDLNRLSRYLEQHWPGSGPMTVEQFPAGYSNLTYLVRRGNEELVLRRPPFGNEVKAAHDMGREFRVLAKLSPAFPTAPKPYLYCDDESVLGAPFYLMERRRGVIIRKSGLAELETNPTLVRQLNESMIDHLAALHTLDFMGIGLGDLGQPNGFIPRQVAGWTKRYEKAQTADVPAMLAVATWLSQNQPASNDAALIHNDYKFDNLILDPNNLARIVAVLDWEMATLGDPLMDLGVSLAYWVQADDSEVMRKSAFGPTHLAGSLTRAELVRRYEQHSRRTVTSIFFYYAYGLFKLAVIVQQIYARYARGHTRDPRFANLDQLVLALAQRAQEAIDQQRI